MLKKRVLLTQLKHAFHTDNSIKIGILGVPFEKGQPRTGVANAPKLIRQYGLVDRLSAIRMYNFFLSL